MLLLYPVYRNPNSTVYSSRFGTGASYLEVTVGDHNRYADISTTYEKAHNVRTFHYHSAYSPSTLDNDIAVLELSSEIEFNDGVQPICLPPVGDEVYDYDRCVTTGWGNTFGRYIVYIFLILILEMIFL